MNFVFKTRNCVSKTRMFALIMMNLQVTSASVAYDRKDYTLERLSNVLDYKNLDFGPADSRLVAAWIGLSRHGGPVEKLVRK